jgi:hypothetical protein
MSTILDLSNVISVSIQGTPVGLGIPNINTAALFSGETPIGGYSGAAFKIYTDPASVVTDWGSGSKAALIASAYFAQNPNPLLTGGYLVIIPLLTGPETVQAALARTANLVYYFGILVDADYHSNGSVFATLSTYVQGLDKMFFYASSNASDYATNGLLDLIRQAANSHTRCLFYADGTANDTLAFAAGYASRILSTDFSGSKTTITMHLKNVNGFIADTTLDQTGVTAVLAAGCDCFVNVAGSTSLLTSGLNQFVDEVYNELWFKFALQTAAFNYLKQTNTKIPQTEIGMEGYKNELRKVCEQAIINGFLAPGSWTSGQTFGDPSALIRGIADIGYYVYSQPIVKQLNSDRLLRKAPTVQIAAKAAGAIHKSSIIVFVNL